MTTSSSSSTMWVVMSAVWVVRYGHHNVHLSLIRTTITLTHTLYSVVLVAVKTLGIFHYNTPYCTTHNSQSQDIGDIFSTHNYWYYLHQRYPHFRNPVLYISCLSSDVMSCACVTTNTSFPRPSAILDYKKRMLFIWPSSPLVTIICFLYTNNVYNSSLDNIIKC